MQHGENKCVVRLRHVNGHFVRLDEDEREVQGPPEKPDDF